MEVSGPLSREPLGRGPPHPNIVPSRFRLRSFVSTGTTLKDCKEPSSSFVRGFRRDVPVPGVSGNDSTREVRRREYGGLQR